MYKYVFQGFFMYKKDEMKCNLKIQSFMADSKILGKLHLLAPNFRWVKEIKRKEKVVVLLSKRWDDRDRIIRTAAGFGKVTLHLKLIHIVISWKEIGICPISLLSHLLRLIKVKSHFEEGFEEDGP